MVGRGKVDAERIVYGGPLVDEAGDSCGSVVIFRTESPVYS